MNNPLPVHRTEMVLTEDGTITIDRLPFQAGQAVEVIVLPRPLTGVTNVGTLRGTPVRYDRPFEPVADADWDATR